MLTFDRFNFKVSEIFCYPIKSCGGISLETASIEKTGIAYDRRWVVIDGNNKFVTQRELKTMSLIKTRFSDNGTLLIVSAPGMNTLYLKSSGYKKGKLLEVSVWQSICLGVEEDHHVNKWFTRFLSKEKSGKYRLVRMPDDGVRIGTDGASHVSYADGYPFLFLSQESLVDLNGKLNTPLPVDRFRPNIVLTGCPAYFEDTMDTCTINGIKFNGKTLCVRCPITTTNQETSERLHEPLKTLAKYRKTKDGVVFARNFCHNGSGLISVGDIVHV